jgi:hypothetical protein
MRATDHFNEDISRALNLHAAASTPGLAAQVADDIRRQAIAAAVAAMDAYLCDAYVDLLAAALVKAKTDPSSFPDGFRKVTLPAGPLLAAYNKRPNWGLRMAARMRMEKDNMLQIGKVPDLFNPALPTGQKLWDGTMPAFFALNRKRLTHYTAAEYSNVPSQGKTKALRKARGTMTGRIGTIVQRRHDIAHNCDRPRQALPASPRPLRRK